MTFGYCINMLAPSGGDGSGRELLPLLGSLGFDYVEMPMAQMMAYDEPSFERLFVRPLKDSGLPCHCCNNFFPGSIRLTGPDADHDAAIAYAEKAMARAEALGARKIVFGSSGARNYPLGYSREDAMAQMRDLLCRLEPLAARHGVTLVMEHLNRLESNLLNTLAEGVALVRELQLPHVRNLLDNYHLMIGNGSLDEIREAGSNLRHIHLARVLGRSLPCPGDETDWPGLWAALRDIGYDGDCSIEAYAPEEQRAERIASALSYLRRLAAQR